MLSRWGGRSNAIRKILVDAILLIVCQHAGAEFRSIDGTGNNRANPSWGKADVELLRLTSIEYGDGSDTPAGSHRASARVISNACSAQEISMPNAAGISDFLWEWGQFLDHDIDLTAVIDPPEPFDIPIPAGDPFFDPESTGEEAMLFDRSFYRHDFEGKRQQVNEITAFIDASNVYGSDEARALELRTLDGSGRLKTSHGRLLPFNVNGFPNVPSEEASFFLAGDLRANEQVGLTAMHTLFVREHNFWASQIRRFFPSSTGEEIYQLARVIVGAEIQAIPYNEFLPVLLGRHALRPYRGYKPAVDPGIANVFSTAAYRFGHSMLSPTLLRLRRSGRPIAAGNLELKDAFFAPEEIIETGGIVPILRGLAKQRAQEIDPFVVDAVRNFLFGPPGAGGVDLASLNIQRGRDHGLPGYNQVRFDCGLSPVRTFAEINTDPDIQANLASAYLTVDDVDIWVGGLAEPHYRRALVGETFYVILKDQFERLRDCDRFWYQRYLPPYLVRLVRRQTLSRIIRRNTRIGRELQRNVFLVP